MNAGESLSLISRTLPGATRTPEKRATVWVSTAAARTALLLSSSEVEMTTVPSSVQATPFEQRSGTVTVVGPLPLGVVAVNVVLAFGGSDAPVGGGVVLVGTATPVAESVTVGAPALEATVSVAAAAPAAVGLNETVRTQLAPGSTVGWHVLAV